MQSQSHFDRARAISETLKVQARDQVIEMINLCELKGDAVEVGTFNGTFADEILAKTAVASLSCVDPYQAYSEFKDAINDLDLDMVYAQAQRFLSRFGDRVKFIREYSLEAAARFENETLDLVYIDGNHQSKFVMQDMVAWWPKLRCGGMMIGDDCVDFDETKRNAAGDITLVHRRNSDGEPDLYGDYGVFHALRTFAAERDLRYILLGSQFFIPKG